MRASRRSSSIGDGEGPTHVWWADQDLEGGGLAGEAVDGFIGSENGDSESSSCVDDPAPYDELFPPSPFASMTCPYSLPDPPEAGPTKGWVYQFKIRLVGIEPMIWRRIQVSALYSFWDLHVAITDAMGWLDSHLHLFSVRNPETGILDPIGIFDAADPDGPGCLPDFKYRIAGYFREPGDRAWYTYDYGDLWVHDVVLEAIVRRQRGKRYPRCLAGAQACPPEDVGGVYGYVSMLEILNDPSHPEFESYVDWLGGSFDPDRFDPKAVRFDSPKMRFELAYYGE